MISCLYFFEKYRISWAKIEYAISSIASCLKYNNEKQNPFVISLLEYSTRGISIRFSNLDTKVTLVTVTALC
jgi:hypothetical protein